MNYKTTNHLILYLLSIFLYSCAGQNSLVRQKAFNNGKIDATTVASPEKKQKIDIIIAILPFRNNSPDKSLDPMGATLSDLVSAQMASKKGFKLVERQRIEEIMSELEFGQTGIIDENTAIQAGKILGANVMAFGSFSVFGKKIVLVIRLVKVETGEIVGGVTQRGENISNLDILAQNAAEKLSNSIVQ